MTYRPIENYGVIGNMRTAALVGLDAALFLEETAHGRAPIGGYDAPTQTVLAQTWRPDAASPLPAGPLGPKPSALCVGASI